MTREEQIRNAANGYKETGEICLTDCFVIASKWVDAHPNWHKFPDEKPKLNQRILIYTRTGRIVETAWRQPILISGEPHGEPTFEDNRYTARNVIAWMERPQPPKFDLL